MKKKKRRDKPDDMDFLLSFVEARFDEIREEIERYKNGKMSARRKK